MKENEKLSLVDLGKRLLEASRNGQADVVKELMQNGAPFTTDWLGTSPLHLAAQHGHTQTAEQLLRSGVSRDARTKVDRTPLHMAAQNGHLPIVELLISFGACVNNRDMLNMTPLHWACEYNHSEIIKALLQAGAQNDIVNKFGKTPLDIAGKKCAIESVALLSAGQIHEQSSASESKSPLESNKRLAERATVSINSVKKRQRTKKFPMTAGSWTGSDATPVNIGKSRKRSSGAPAALNASGNTTLPNGRRLSAQTQYQNAGSPSLRSPTENSIASLVSAAELVKSKAEAQQTDATATTSQDSSVLDTLATLATATLSHNTGPTPSSTTQHVTAISGRGINVAPLTLTTGTASHAASALTTPLTPSTLFPLQSPLAALSALTSLSTPTQTSPLPNIAMSPLAFQMPVNLTPQQLLMSGTQLVSSVAQQGSVPSTSVMSTAESSNSTSSESANLLTSIAPAQLLTQPFLAYTGGGNTGHFLTQIPQGQAKVEHDNSKTQDSAEQKTDDSTGQQTQEVYVTVQVPSNIPTVQSQQIGEHNFTLQPVIVQPGTTGDQNLLAAQTVGGEKNPEQPTSTTTSQLVQVQLPPGLISQSPGQFVQLPGVPEPISIAQLQHLLVNQNMAGTVPQVVISPQKIQLAPSSPLQQVSTQAPQPSQAQAAPSIMPQQSQQQQQISQQLMQQSIPQGLLHQSAVAPVELQQSPLPHSIPSQVFLQVQEDFRKLIEQQKVEEERQRKELEEKVITLEQHSKKYRSELEIAQKAAETYRDQLQAESRERARLSQLYESPKKGSNNTASTVVESAQK